MINGAASWLFGFGRFWYEFIVGDDPWMAVGVAAGLVMAGLLLHAGQNVWWLIPVLVIGLLGISIRRARPT